MQDIWSFVAMEYYALILNRTYVISVDEREISGVVCRGITAVEAGTGLARYITGQLAVHGNLNEPNSYISVDRLTQQNTANFTLSHASITSVGYTSGKKWGMGNYPHDGRVFVGSARRRREFIILGNQSGAEIAERLSAAVGRANNSFKGKPLRGCP